eukprot:1425650-Rhodomonas_salina.4
MSMRFGTRVPGPEIVTARMVVRPDGGGVVRTGAGAEWSGSGRMLPFLEALLPFIDALLQFIQALLLIVDVVLPERVGEEGEDEDEEEEEEEEEEDRASMESGEGTGGGGGTSVERTRSTAGGGGRRGSVLPAGGGERRGSVVGGETTILVEVVREEEVLERERAAYESGYAKVSSAAVRGSNSGSNKLLSGQVDGHSRL